MLHVTPGVPYFLQSDVVALSARVMMHLYKVVVSAHKKWKQQELQSE